MTTWLSDMQVMGAMGDWSSGGKWVRSDLTPCRMMTNMGVKELVERPERKHL